MTILRPGDYYFEVETAPSVDKGSLYQMLQSVGFGLVVFDQEDDALSAFSVGALPTGLPGAKTPAVSSSLTSFRPTARSVVTPTVKAAATATAPPPPPPKTPITSLSRKPAAPPPPPVNPKLSSVVPSTVRKAAAVPIPKTHPFKVRPPTPPQSQPPPQASPPAPEVTYAEPAPVQEYVQESAPAGGAGEGYNFTPPSPQGETEASPTPPAPVEDERLPAPIVETLEGIKASLLLLWQRWAEWGSPFLSGPRVSGEGGNRFRFMGSVPVEMELNDTPILKWLYAQKVGFNPWDSLRQNFVPTPLLHGKVYEFRILAHDRTTPTRDSVKEALGRMGFAPMKLINLKRHMRMPGRQGASLSLWWGMGQWANATSVVTQDEPFIFDELREVML